MIDSLQRISSAPVLNYLKAKIAVRQDNENGVIHALASETLVFDDSVLQAGKEQLLGEAYVMKKEYQLARIHFWQSLNYTTNKAAKQRIDDWLELCGWYEEHVKKY